MARLKVGILGLRRGAAFAALFNAMDNIEVTAACDLDEQRRTEFAKSNAHVALHDDYAAMLKTDTDIVVVASGCPDHGPHAVQALRAGKHVFSEVTAFYTIAEGVELVRTVEETGLTYFLAENCCWFARIQEMTRIWRQGRMGDFIYGECEYIHEIGDMLRGYLRDGKTDHWRLWLPPIYYCTHSLGPIFMMTGDRPMSVVGMGTGPKMPEDFGKVDSMQAALIKMESGAVVRLTCGFMCPRNPASLWVSMYGTKGEMETGRWWPADRLHVFEKGQEHTQHDTSYIPSFREMADQASKAGHGGADFYTVLEFSRAFAEGRKPAIDVYLAADMTLPGILAHRSSVEGGRPFEIPDLRDEKTRKRCETDTWSPRRQTG
jgi:predicted dehydrogenase